MELEKIQKFLKTKHKFDKKPEITDEFELLNEKLQDLKRGMQTKDSDAIKKKVGTLLVELIKFSNNHDLDLNDILTNVMGFSL
jgi:DNA-binding transcriptional MerR regulator